MIRVALLALWMVLLLSGRIAQAQIPVVIVVPHVDTPDYSAYERRLRSELIAAGFEPVSVEIPGTVEAPLLKRTALRLTSSAAISISIGDGVVRGMVWIQGRNRSNDSLRLVADYPLTEQAPTVFAVRATDVLHGALLEMGYVESTPAPEALPPVPRSENVARALPNDQDNASNGEPHAKKGVAAPPKPTPKPPVQVPESRPAVPPTELTPPSWDLVVLGQFGVPIDAFPLSYGLSAMGLHRLGRHWRAGLAANYFAPVTTRALPNQGQASVTQAFFGPRIEYRIDLATNVTAHGFLELGLHAVSVKGTATAPYTARSPYWMTGYLSAGLGTCWKLSRNWGLIGDVGLLLPARSSDVVVVRTVVGKAAGPTLLTAAGVQFSF